MGKERGVKILGDAKMSLAALNHLLRKEINYSWLLRDRKKYLEELERYKKQWIREQDRLRNLGLEDPMAQSEVIGVVNDFCDSKDVVVAAAGSLPGDLLKLDNLDQVVILKCSFTTKKEVCRGEIRVVSASHPSERTLFHRMRFWRQHTCNTYADAYRHPHRHINSGVNLNSYSDRYADAIADNYSDPNAYRNDCADLRPPNAASATSAIERSPRCGANVSLHLSVR